MEFIDNTGHIFSLLSYNEKPIGYEYDEQQYIFWIDNDNSNFLSVNNYYGRSINVLIDLTKFGITSLDTNITSADGDLINVEVELDSNVYKLIKPVELQNKIDNNDTILDIIDISNDCTKKLTNEDIFIIKTTESISPNNTTIYGILPLYVVAYATEPGSWISNILIHIFDNDGTDEWCPISVGGQFNNIYEELVIHGQNMGISLPRDIIKAVYQSSIINETVDETLYNQKLKEYILNFMCLKGEIGNFNSAIKGLQWFGYGDKLSISQLLQTDNNIKQQFIHNFFDISYDLLDSFKTFRNSTYVSLIMKINQETGEYEEQNKDHLFGEQTENDNVVEFAGEGNPIMESLLSKYIVKTVGRDNETYDYIAPYFNFSMFDLGLKLACVKYFYSKYFLPIHLKIHSASLSHKVYANDLKLTGNYRVVMNEAPICTEDTDYDVIFPSDHVHYFTKQTHYVDENFNEFVMLDNLKPQFYDIERKKYFYICDTCLNIPITFTTNNKYYDCVLILEKKQPKNRHIQYIYNSDIICSIKDRLVFFDNTDRIINREYFKFAFKYVTNNAKNFSVVFDTYENMVDYIIKTTTPVAYDVNTINDALTIKLEDQDVTITNKQQYIHSKNHNTCYIVPSYYEIFKQTLNDTTTVKRINVTTVNDYVVKIITDVDNIQTMLKYDINEVNTYDTYSKLSNYDNISNITKYDKSQLNFIYNDESVKVFESHFRFIQFNKDNKSYKYKNFIIYPKYINDSLDYWVNNDFIIRLLVNNKWYDYEFTMKIPEFNVQLGKLQYKYWTNDDNVVTNFNQLKDIIEHDDETEIIFNSFMYEPKIATYNNINYIDDLVKLTENDNENRTYFHNNEFIQSGDFYKYIDFNGHKIYIHKTIQNRNIEIPISYFQNLDDWDSIYLFIYNNYTYLYEENGTTHDTIQYVTKYSTLIEDANDIIVHDDNNNIEYLRLGLYIDRENNNKYGYCTNGNFIWLKYSNYPNGEFMDNRPVDANNISYAYIGIAINQKTSVESNDPNDYIWKKYDTNTITIDNTIEINIKYSDTEFTAITKQSLNDSMMYDKPKPSTKSVGISYMIISTDSEQQSAKHYVWNQYNSGDGFLTNAKDTQIYWFNVDENLNKYITFKNNDTDSCVNIYIDISEIKPIIDIPLSLINNDQISVYVEGNTVKIIDPNSTEQQVITSSYRDNGMIIGENNTGLLIEDSYESNGLRLEFVNDYPPYYKVNDNKYYIYESYHQTRLELLNKYNEIINISPSNKYLNSVLLFDLYTKKLNDQNFEQFDDIIHVKDNFEVLCNGIIFKKDITERNKIYLSGTADLTEPLNTDNVDLFSFYWSNDHNIDDKYIDGIGEQTYADYIIYQKVGANNNILPYEFSDSEKSMTQPNIYNIKKSYVNIDVAQQYYGDHLIIKSGTNDDYENIGIVITDKDKVNDKFDVDIDDIVMHLFIQSFITRITSTDESNNSESDNSESNNSESNNSESDNSESNNSESDNSESDNSESNNSESQINESDNSESNTSESNKNKTTYFIDGNELQFTFKFCEVEDGEMKIKDEAKNITFNEALKDDSTIKLFIDIKLCNSVEIPYIPINVKYLQNNNNITISTLGEDQIMTVTDPETRQEKTYTLIKKTHDEYVKTNTVGASFDQPITDNPGLYWIKVDDIAFFDNEEKAKREMEDAQTLKMGNNMLITEVKPRSVIQSIDDYLKIIESITTDQYDEFEYYVNPYSYKNYLQFDLTGRSGKFKIEYEIGYKNTVYNDVNLRMVVYIVDKNDNTKILPDTTINIEQIDNKTTVYSYSFELTGDEKNVSVFFQIQKVKQSAIDTDTIQIGDNNMYIIPHIYQCRYEYLQIPYEAPNNETTDDVIQLMINDTTVSYHTDSQYNLSPAVKQLYKDFFKKSDDHINDALNKIYNIPYIIEQVIKLDQLYLDYDMYLMHDYDNWHVVFISKQTCDKVQTPNQLLIDHYDDIEYTSPITDESYLLKFVKHEKQFLINRMECNYTHGVNHFDKDDIIVGTVINNNRLPVDLDISSKWNINLMSIGKSKQYVTNSSNEMCIISIPNNDNQYESGYYNVNVDYSLNGFNQQEMKQCTRLLIK